MTALCAGCGLARTLDYHRPVPIIPAPVDLVIFDCDGVLVDSEPLSNADAFERELAAVPGAAETVPSSPPFREAGQAPP